MQMWTYSFIFACGKIRSALQTHQMHGTIQERTTEIDFFELLKCRQEFKTVSPINGQKSHLSIKNSAPQNRHLPGPTLSQIYEIPRAHKCSWSLTQGCWQIFGSKSKIQVRVLGPKSIIKTSLFPQKKRKDG